MADLWGDPLRDYRQRYTLPDQWVGDEAAWPRVQFDGYMSIILDLLPPPPAEVLDVGFLKAPLRYHNIAASEAAAGRFIVQGIKRI